MEDTKSLFASKSVWGVVVVVLGAVVPPVAAKYGYVVTAADGADLTALAGKVTELLGAALALYGRIKATKRIG